MLTNVRIVKKVVFSFSQVILLHLECKFNIAYVKFTHVSDIFGLPPHPPEEKNPVTKRNAKIIYFPTFSFAFISFVCERTCKRNATGGERAKKITLRIYEWRNAIRGRVFPSKMTYGRGWIIKEAGKAAGKRGHYVARNGRVNAREKPPRLSTWARKKASNSTRTRA